MSKTTEPGEFRPIVPLIIGAAMLIQTLNSNIIANALPPMAKAFGVSATDLSILITCYLLAMAACLPISSWFSERFGSRAVFRGAIIAYMIASLLCGLAQSLDHLIAARIFAGASAAMMTPVGRTVLLHSTPRNRIIEAMSYVTIPSLLGPVLGPPLGGFIVTYWSWPWIFFINVPVALVAALLVTIYIPRDTEVNKRAPDLVGAILAGGGLALLVFGLQSLALHTIGLSIALAATVGGIVFTAGYVHHARRHPTPILDFSLFRTRSFAAGIVGGLFPRLMIGSMPFLLALQFQVGFGLSAFSSGLLTFTSAVAAILMKASSTPIIQRFGFRRVLIVNAVFVAVTFAVLIFVADTTPYALIIAILFLGGFARSLQFTAINSVSYIDLEKRSINAGSTWIAMSQPLMQSMGISIAAGLVQLLAMDNAGQPTTASIAPVFAAMGLISLFSIFLFVTLPKDAGKPSSDRASPGTVPQDEEMP